MVNRNLLREYELPEGQLREELDAVFDQQVEDWLPAEGQDFQENRVVTGRVLHVAGDEVWVDVGYKSQGVLELREWFDEGLGQIVPPRPGDEVQVLLEAVEDETGSVVLSYRKAKRQREWEEVLERYKEGDVVSGPVTRKVKGGLLVNIGVNVFLPASQVDVRRPHDIADYIGKTIECKVLIIDEARHNIVVSRRKLIEDQRAEMKTKLLAEIEPGQIRKGVVKNITDFGAFVDLGGIDGLLHVTDMAWHRVTNPREVVQIDQELEVFVVRVDKEKEKIALGLKQKTPSPWANVAEKYPVGSRHTGEVVNVMSYGAFVKLEPGIEGLVHISEMSWTRKVAHPSEVVQKGDKVTCVVLNVDQDRKRIALGLKQMNNDPWEGDIPGRYRPGDVKRGKVTKLTNFGVFVELEPGLEGLLHISELADHKVDSPEDVVKVGDEIDVKILRVDAADRKIGLSHRQSHGAEEGEAEGEEAPRKAGRPRERELRGGTGSAGGQLFTMPQSAEQPQPEEAPEQQ